MRLRPGAEHPLDRSRPTARTTSTSRSRRSVSATAGASSTTTASYHGSGADDGAGGSAPTPTCSSTCRAVRGSGATSTHAIPRRCSSTPIRRSRSWRSPRPKPWYVEFFQQFDPPLHVRREHRHAGVARTGRRLHLAQDLAAGDARTTGARTRRHVDRFSTGDDLADRELRRRRRQQGSGIRQVHRPAVAHHAAVRAGDQRPADAAARARLEHGRRDGGLAHASTTIATSSSSSKAEFGVAKHTYVSTRSGWFSDRTECYLAAGRPALVQDTGWSGAPAVWRGAAGVLVAGRSARGHRRVSTPTTRARPARARDCRRALRRADRLLPTLLDTCSR